MNQYHFREKIFDAILEYTNQNDIKEYTESKYFFSSYHEDIDNQKLFFEVNQSYCEDIEFELMCIISDIIGTRKMFFDKREDRWSYSEHTYGTDRFVILNCFDVKFPTKENV